LGAGYLKNELQAKIAFRTRNSSIFENIQ